MKQLQGMLRLRDDGRFDIFDSRAGQLYSAQETDKVSATTAKAPGGDETWIVRLNDDAEVDQQPLTDDEWNALFTVPSAGIYSDRSSYRNTWCDTCPSTEGAAGGVCG